jgi:hypothetical protein
VPPQPVPPLLLPLPFTFSLDFQFLLVQEIV